MAVITGTSGANNIVGTALADQIDGLGGDDTIDGAGGDDFIVGGTGNDFLIGGIGADIFAYTARQFNSDVISDFSAGDRIDLAALNIADLTTLQPFIRQSGLDTIISFVFGNSFENITISNILPSALTASSFIFNTSAAALTVNGSNSDDTLFGGNGNDRVLGFGNDDTLSGGSGNDFIDGGSGNDFLIGGIGADIFAYTARQFNSDVISDFSAGDRIDLAALNIADLTTLQPFIRQSGLDTIISFVFGNSFENITISNILPSALTASSFIFNTSAAALTVNGSNSDDTLFGGNGNDRVLGFGNDDTLSGGSGNDFIDGGSGNDFLIGGIGADIFAYTARQFNSDVISDFSAGDRIDLAALNIADLTTLQPFIRQSGLDTIISFVFGNSFENITISNILPSALTASSFIFNTSAAALTVNGSNSDDTLFGGNGNDRVLGFGNDDTLSGGSGNDFIDGGSGNDFLIGGLGTDMLTGGTGSDIFSFARQFGDDIITDFDTGDRIDLAAINVADLASLQPFIRQSGANSVITLGFGGMNETITINGVLPTAIIASFFTFNTSIAGLVVGGTAANDILFGGNGNDTLTGGLGADTLTGGSGTDTVSYDDNLGAVFVNLSSGQGFGNAAQGDTYSGVENVLGSSAADFVIGDLNVNRLDGAGGDDILIGGLGADVLIGGAGSDTASYEDNFGAVFANLSTGQGFGNAAQGDSYSGIENLTGGAFADFFIGDGVANRLDGGAGDDILIGGLGGDVLIGGAGLDTASYEDNFGAVFVNLASGQGFGNAAQGDSYSGIENLTGGAFADFFIGNSAVNRLDGAGGDDILIGQLGGDVLVGGAGSDTASYEDNFGAVFVNLTLGQGFGNAAQGDTYQSIENLIGSVFFDTFIGDGAANILAGGRGNDTLTGAGGADVFRFDTALDGVINVDALTDFNAADDTIQLDDAVFAALGLGTLSASAFATGASATTAAQRIIYNAATGSLFYDPDGSGAAAQTLFATIQNNTILSNADFIVV